MKTNRLDSLFPLIWTLILCGAAVVGALVLVDLIRHVFEVLP